MGLTSNKAFIEHSSVVENFVKVFFKINIQLDWINHQGYSNNMNLR